MERYIGIDVHTQSCTIAVVNQGGKELQTEVVETNGEVLVRYLKLIPGRKYLCLEAGNQSQWLSEILSLYVHELVIIWPEKKTGNKNDRLDALGLAERVRTGKLGRKIFKAPKEFTGLRQLVSCYNMITQDIVRTKNRIKSVYRSRGILATGRKLEYAQPSQHLQRDSKQGVQLMCALLEQQEACKEQIQKHMLKEAQKHKVTALLQTAPGIGEVRAAQLLSVVITPYRFRTTRQFWAYCGFGIVTHSSSDWVQQANGQWIKAPVVKLRGLNRNHSRQAKNLFKAAAITVTTQCKSDPLYAHYQRMLQNGIRPNLARLTIARKIAAITLSMWKREEAYNPQKFQRSKILTT